MSSPAGLRLRLILALVTMLGVWGGCSSEPQSGKVKGKVTFKGQPVKEGTVTLLSPEGHGNAEAAIDPDGNYAVANPLPVGEYIVEIKPLTVIVDTDPGKSPPAPVEKNAPNIPRKYRMQGTTPLKVNVVAGDNEANFEMTP